MNFGHKVTIAYTFFVVMMVSMVVLCIKNKDLFLVSTDYYKKEIAYQDEIDKYQNTSNLPSPVKVERAEGKVKLSFPEELIGSEGEVYFYRPSNGNLDFKIPLEIRKSTVQSIPVEHLAKGLWVVKMEWSKDGKSYLREQKLVF